MTLITINDHHCKVLCQCTLCCISPTLQKWVTIVVTDLSLTYQSVTKPLGCVPEVLHYLELDCWSADPLSTRLQRRPSSCGSLTLSFGTSQAFLWCKHCSADWPIVIRVCRCYLGESTKIRGFTAELWTEARGSVLITSTLCGVNVVDHFCVLSLTFYFMLTFILAYL